jgi:hypothetical protein
MGSRAKNRQTFSKMSREQAVREKRALKAEKKSEKKEAAAAALAAEAAGITVPEEGDEEETEAPAA